MAVTNTYNEFLKAELESEKTQSQIKKLQDWLTGQTQLQQQQYQQTAQTAATQASYDISGAYANYLKQQRSIAAQGRLESGYKEELSDVLQQQYQSDYAQAKAVQEQTTTKAYETALAQTQEYSDIYEKSLTDLYAQAEESALMFDKFYKTVASKIGEVEDLSKLYTALGVTGGLGAYDPETRELTTRGKGLWAQWLGAENLSNILKEEDEELYQWALKNYDKAYEYITGETTPISEEEALKMTYAGGYLETFERPSRKAYLDALNKQKVIAALPQEIINYGQTQLKLTDEELSSAVSSALQQHAGTLQKSLTDTNTTLKVKQNLIKELAEYKASDYSNSTEYINAILQDLYKNSYFREDTTLYADVIDAITKGIQTTASKKYNV